MKLYLHSLFTRPSNGGGSKKPTANGSSSSGAAAKPTATNSGSGSRPANVPAASGANGNEGAASLGAAENFGFPPNFGRAGEDFPIYGPHNMPATTFSCEGKVKGGYDLRSFFLNF
jgi:hypothetical protein